LIKPRHRYFELKENLERIFGGTVDPIVEDAMTNHYFRQEVEHSRKNFYAG
jgi:predicted nucleotidyltransferase